MAYTHNPYSGGYPPPATGRDKAQHQYLPTATAPYWPPPPPPLTCGVSEPPARAAGAYPTEAPPPRADRPEQPKWAVTLPGYEGATHPCLNHRSGVCKFGGRCYFRGLPRSWCVECLLGRLHDGCTGGGPPTHPCLRVFGECRYGDECAFRDFPWPWCLYCLRGQTHKTCSGICPHTMPQTGERLRAAAKCAARQEGIRAREGLRAAAKYTRQEKIRARRRERRRARRHGLGNHQ